jgi:hypothetical protein
VKAYNQEDLDATWAVFSWLRKRHATIDEPIQD